MSRRLFNKNIASVSMSGSNLNYPGVAAANRRANQFGEGQDNKINEADEMFGNANSFAFMITNSNSVNLLNRHRSRAKQLIRGIRSGRKFPSK